MNFPPHIRLSAAAAATALFALATPLLAASNDEATAVAVRQVNLPAETSVQAQRLLGRLSDAAMEACGASSFSVMQYRQAVRGSACWRTSMTDVVHRIGDPRLTAAFERRGTAQIALGDGAASTGN